MLTNNRLVIYTTDQKLESFFFFSPSLYLFNEKQ